MITCRHFYVKSHAVTTPEINLKDLPGSAGRLDILARCINASFWLSHDIRRDVVFHTILHGEPSPPVYIRFEGSKLRKVSPDERSIAIFIKKAIERIKEEKEIESTPGIFVSRKNFERLIKEHRDKKYYLLVEDGKYIEHVEICNEPFFFLGDHKDLDDDEKELLYEYDAEPISLGKRSYLASHCITIINWLLDRKFCRE
ncbi:MAG: tRNA (pseudouridine(54)-N(1))-methyltransferase TrmY [Thermoplasmata archaeon]|nr:MAG: tRNA (pseudouridine(54)-N(1))-methyltransferase TrmY [Thermoplasmata archaeon]KAA0015256.1 MAG: tRNA (pseudouridine(54)-N(1))-methyltransferase TrmY [Thermoplasmata archaeon]OYT59680.1 MAG: tRNA (pseudouridine(54)-N(1))-methyltransferase TrmY [Thermoplasmatales archaeon ex4484_30]